MGRVSPGYTRDNSGIPKKRPRSVEAETEEKSYGLQGKAEIHPSNMAKMQARKMEIAVSIDQLKQELQVIYDQAAEPVS